MSTCTCTCIYVIVIHTRGCAKLTAALLLLHSGVISSIAQSEVCVIGVVLLLETKELIFPSDLGEAVARQLQTENICDAVSTRKVCPQEKKCLNTHTDSTHISFFLFCYNIFL